MASELCGKVGMMVVTTEHPNGDPQYACVLPKGHGGKWHKDKFDNRFTLKGD